MIDQSPVARQSPNLAVQHYFVDQNDKGQPNAEGRRFARSNWNSFVREADLDEEQEQKVLRIMAEMQAQYVAYEKGINEEMTTAMLTHDPKQVKKRARDSSPQNLTKRSKKKFAVVCRRCSTQHNSDCSRGGVWTMQ